MTTNKELLQNQVILLDVIVGRLDELIENLKFPHHEIIEIEKEEDKKHDEKLYKQAQNQEWIGSFNFADHFQFVNSIDAIEDPKTRKITYDATVNAQEAIIKELINENIELEEQILKMVDEKLELKREIKRLKTTIDEDAKRWEDHQKVYRDNYCDHVKYRQAIEHLTKELNAAKLDLKNEIEARNKEWDKES